MVSSDFGRRLHLNNTHEQNSPLTLATTAIVACGCKVTSGEKNQHHTANRQIDRQTDKQTDKQLSLCYEEAMNSLLPVAAELCSNCYPSTCGQSFI